MLSEYRPSKQKSLDICVALAGHGFIHWSVKLSSCSFLSPLAASRQQQGWCWRFQGLEGQCPAGENWLHHFSDVMEGYDYTVGNLQF